jgi:hypothetical protein
MLAEIAEVRTLVPEDNFRRSIFAVRCTRYFEPSFLYAEFLESAMDQARISILDEQIKQQIELVAELICEQKHVLEAVQVLDALTRELVVEKCKP